MAGPKEEWLIWDRRFQFGYSCLNQRLKTTEEATQQVSQLDQKTTQLAATSKHLEDASDGLRDRIQKLEQALGQFSQLDERIQDLTASGRSLKEENNVLNDRILQLERESSHRDQENQLAQDQLKEKLSAQDEDFRSVIVAVKGLHELDRAERGQRGEEIRQLKTQVEALIAHGHTPGVPSRDASRRISQATTEDENDRIPVNHHAKHQLQQQQQRSAAHPDIEMQGMLVKAQAPFTRFEDHLRHAEKVFRQHETEAVRAFVGSVQEGYQTLLKHKLEEQGEWTWQAAREEGYRIVDTEKKAKRRSARLLAASSHLP